MKRVTEFPPKADQASSRTRDYALTRPPLAEQRDRVTKREGDEVGTRAEKFEDLVVWQMSRVLSRDIYSIANTINQRDYGFCDQIRRSGVSIMNNIAEGFERGSNKDFAKFIFIARGSCGEVRSMLYVALDQHYIERDEFDRLSGQCRQCSAAIWGLIKSLSRNSNWIERVQIGAMILFSSLLCNPVTL